MYLVCEDSGHGRNVSTVGGLENRSLLPVVNAILPFGLWLRAKQTAVGQRNKQGNKQPEPKLLDHAV